MCDIHIRQAITCGVGSLAERDIHCVTGKIKEKHKCQLCGFAQLWSNSLRQTVVASGDFDGYEINWKNYQYEDQELKKKASDDDGNRFGVMVFVHSPPVMLCLILLSVSYSIW